MNTELVRDVVQWDIVNWGNLITQWEGHITTKRSLRCLEIGARQGGLSLWAALNHHQAVCSDVKSPEPTAKPLHEKYKVTANISYEAINILDIPYQNHFDIVFLKSILASVGGNNQKEGQEVAMRSIYNSLKPGGKLLFAENLVSSKLHTFARKKFVPWGGHVRYPDLDEMAEFLKDFKTVEYKTYGFFGAFGKTEKQRILLGKLDALVNQIVPMKWNYLIIGTATK